MQNYLALNLNLISKFYLKSDYSIHYNKFHPQNDAVRCIIIEGENDAQCPA